MAADSKNISNRFIRREMNAELKIYNLFGFVKKFTCLKLYY